MKNTDERANQRANQIRWLEKEGWRGLHVVSCSLFFFVRPAIQADP